MTRRCGTCRRRRGSGRCKRSAGRSSGLVADGRAKHAAECFWLPASGVHQGRMGRIGSHETSCDRPETGVHCQGHTVAPPFRGVTRATVDTSGGQALARGGDERRAAAARMLESGASLRSVAAALGVSKSAVAKWRNGVHPHRGWWTPEWTPRSGQWTARRRCPPSGQWTPEWTLRAVRGLAGGTGRHGASSRPPNPGEPRDRPQGSAEAADVSAGPRVLLLS